MFFFFFLPTLNYQFNFYCFINIYQQIYEIISGDFFLFYFFFFLIFPQINFFIGLLLGLFSFFFIFFYFTLKFFQQTVKFKQKNFLFLRKQQLLHQANYKSIVVNFQ